MSAYYNEHDPFAAAWLRELIKDGLIADGEVDERNIQDVSADDVRGFTQCHFFAGIGGWSYALRLAGWSDARPVWTGSCPCQPFSSAGTREGGRDDRHLWPHWARLIRECRPVTIVGEQVESAIAHGWLDAVFDDLEREGYACGAACLPAASVGAFHIRQRLWFVAESERRATERQRLDVGTATGGAQGATQEWERFRADVGDGSNADVLVDAEPSRYRCERDNPPGWRESLGGGLMDHTERNGCERGRLEEYAHVEGARGAIADGPGARGCWDGAIWIDCRDGKRRPTEPGIQPLSHGFPNRVGTLRGAGNAIVPQVAAAFITAYLECAR